MGWLSLRTCQEFEYKEDTIDEELKRRAKDFDVIDPIPSDVMREYHEYVAKRIKT